MMTLVSQAIDCYIKEEIRLSQSDISSAVKSREWFLELVKKEIRQRTEQPVLFSERNLLYFGSYFKGTKVRSVDEFDVLVIIDSNTGQFKQNDVLIGNGLGNSNPNHKYDSSYLKSDGSGVSPIKTLNWLKEIVESATGKFGVETPIRNGQAITATIKSKNLKIDLIPAGIFKNTNNGDIFYNIPKGDKGNGWILTAPHNDIERLKKVAKGKNNFTNIIRICKHIRDNYHFVISSFAIETAIVEYGERNYWNNDLYNDLRAVLQMLAYTFRSGRIVDTFDSKNNLISGIDSLSWYAERLEKIVKEMDECDQLSDLDEVKNKIYSLFENG
ncbi:hypothetical protein [Methanogenium organophilum]|uniref:Nucleotidyltransferase n=1 Tax=Methanogenium organophilum TaxID=2199 RepID=A0A9X9T8A0_METOG|nr:hypothetical protein [Methanogenium organophilum]WAI00942.1 hypothetical protein OU421_11055 [Methanogenium organophilum]